MAMTQQKRGRGRPKGSKNKPVRDVEYVAPRCGWCDSTAVVCIHTNTMDYRGLDDNNKPYTKRIWRRMRCNQCGHISINHGFEFNAEDWK